MTGKDVSPKKDLSEKAGAIKRFEYSPLGSELIKKTSLAEKQYQVLYNFFMSDEKEEPLTINQQ